MKNKNKHMYIVKYQVGDYPYYTLIKTTLKGVLFNLGPSIVPWFKINPILFTKECTEVRQQKENVC